MNTVSVNVAKTSSGYNATIDILPGWILSVEGIFSNFRKELEDSVNQYIEWAKEDGDEYPHVFNSEYEFMYRFDVESLLCFYNGIFSRAAISRISGINERQLGHYICGRSAPRKKQREKILHAFHYLGRELLSVTL